LEKAYKDVQWISNSEQDDLSLVLDIHRRPEGEVRFVDPAFVLDDSFSLKALVLETDVQSEFHKLI
jgi:hypothetical protein